jgi:hypothetical protein
MPAGKYDILIEQGTRFQRVVTWQPGGVAANLTGFTGSSDLSVVA